MSRITWAFLLILVLLLSACQPGGFGAAPTPTASPTPQPTATPTATPIPPRVLNICLGEAPTTLYLYGGVSRSGWSVLEAIYDGPVDTTNGLQVPVILQDLGAAEVRPVAVQRGDAVMDASGNLALLDTSLKVLPAGCREASCAVQWDGSSALEMDQLVVTFRLKPGLVWSDGAPLTADDSLYAYELDSNGATPTNKWLVDRTQSYQVVDDTTVVFTGRPGYVSAVPADHFWQPLPRHAWGSIAAADLLTQELSTQKPLGWGPYMIESVQPGQSVQMRRNPNYFRAAEGLPYFDLVNYTFLTGSGQQLIEAVQNGQCDLVDQSTLLEDQLETLKSLDKEGQVRLYTGLGLEFEQLAFGIKLANYDAGYSPFAEYRQDFLSDVRLRQAFAFCLDRQKLVDTLFAGLSEVPTGFYPSGHPLYAAELQLLPYNPDEGMRLLEQIGWKDFDSDPTTPRLAQGVANVLTGQPLVVNYLTSEAPLRKKAAEILAQSLAGCGIQVNLQVLPVDSLYQPGPEGVLFGRKFDLAQLSWQTGHQSACQLYTSAQIPNSANGWLGSNIIGYSDPVFDAACQTAFQADPVQVEANLVVQQAFAAALPAIPLYFPVRAAASRVDLCGYQLDLTARSNLSGIEMLNYGDACP